MLVVYYPLTTETRECKYTWEVDDFYWVSKLNVTAGHDKLVSKDTEHTSHISSNLVHWLRMSRGWFHCFSKSKVTVMIEKRKPTTLSLFCQTLVMVTAGKIGKACQPNTGNNSCEKMSYDGQQCMTNSYEVYSRADNWFWISSSIIRGFILDNNHP